MIFWSIYVASHSRGPAFSVHGKGWWETKGLATPRSCFCAKLQGLSFQVESYTQDGQREKWTFCLRAESKVLCCVKCRAGHCEMWRKPAGRKGYGVLPAARTEGAQLSAPFQPLSPAIVEQDPWILPWVTLSDLWEYLSYLQQENHGAIHQPLARVPENAGRSLGKGSWFHLVSSFLFLFFFFSPLKRITYSLT